MAKISQMKEANRLAAHAGRKTIKAEDALMASQ
jgi:histone H3/H4